MIVSGLVRYHDGLRDLLNRTDSVEPAPWNYNNGDGEAIGESIDENGMVAPLLIQQSTGYIIHGNHTWAEVVERRAELCPMIFLDVTEPEAIRIGIAMNEVAKRARPDKSALLDLLTHLEQPAVGTGVSEYTIEALQHLEQVPVHYESNDWPMLSIRLPPHLIRAFRDMTHEADTDADRFELLLRIAGWGQG